MTCDDYQSRHATSRWLRLRWQWHSRRCPQCAAAAKALAGIRRELCRTEPLPQRLRTVWVQAAAGVHPERAAPGWSGRRIATTGLIAATAALLALGTLYRKLVIDRPGIEPVLVEAKDAGNSAASPVPRERPIDPSNDLARLGDDVESMRSEVLAVAKKADLIEVRQRAAAMIETYSQW
jgi:hypothetical protein